MPLNRTNQAQLLTEYSTALQQFASRHPHLLSVSMKHGHLCVRNLTRMKSTKYPYRATSLLLYQSTFAVLYGHGNNHRGLVFPMPLNGTHQAQLPAEYSNSTPAICLQTATPQALQGSMAACVQEI